MNDTLAMQARDMRFADYHPSLEKQAAIAEANRCLYCFDAPCMVACPTHIDVPTFIKKIASGNVSGSARTILDANILGHSCSRACPVDVLCEGSCVMHRYNKQPIQIGLLQRYAMENTAVVPFVPGASSGKKVALIGAGPASMACAAELRRYGIDAVIYDARPIGGGLNTHGIAEYKLPMSIALQEVELLQELGVTFRYQQKIDAEQLAELDAEYDAIFIGTGLGAIHRLGLEKEDLRGVTDALDLIEEYKTGKLTSVQGKVVVVGAGNTAIDAAIAAVRLGAQEVSMLYRRGVEEMSAFAFEYEHAKSEGVRFVWHVQPVAIHGEQHVHAIECARMQTTEDQSLVPITGSNVLMDTDMLVLAIGQATHTQFLKHVVKLERGRVVIDRMTGQTSNPKYFAGGDCTNGGREVVDAVADGKRAGIAIASWLEVK